MTILRVTRREFVAAVGGAAACPLVARAQQTGRLRRVVVAMIGPQSDLQQQQSMARFRDGLRALGWTEGQNIRIEIIWVGVGAEAAKVFVVGIAANPPDVVVTIGLNGFLAMRRDANAVPLVFVNLPDPVVTGLVPSLTNSGGNFTGLTAYEFSIAGKWLQVLKEIAPSVTRVAMTFGTSTPVGENFYRSLQAAAGSSGVETVAIRIDSSADIQSGIAAFAATPNGGLIAAAEAGSIVNRALIVNVAARYRLPAVYPIRDFIEEGGLAFYGMDFLNLFDGAATYVDRILRGTKPADLPIQAPTKFELVINLKVAKTLGLDITPSILARADEVIE
jgi:putative tryptophan/tyrosine transport system substrate-binding protein